MGRLAEQPLRSAVDRERLALAASPYSSSYCSANTMPPSASASMPPGTLNGAVSDAGTPSISGSSDSAVTAGQVRAQSPEQALRPEARVSSSKT